MSEHQRYCPDDQTPLEKHRERGVVIDTCPRCGVQVLDRGELPAIVRTLATQTGFNPRLESSHSGGAYHHGTSDSHSGGHGRGHRRESFFGDLFEGGEESHYEYSD
jgi:Zn-finger nucleic acid-binding protein